MQRSHHYSESDGKYQIKVEKIEFAEKECLQMKSISKDLLGLLTGIFVIFGLDNLHLNALTISSISSHTKILAALSVLAIVAGWKFWTRHSVYLPLFLVISTNLAVSAHYETQHAVYPFSVLETALLGIPVYFSYAVSRWISYISDELEKMLLKNIHKPIAKLKESLDDINNCLYQSRRSGHPLSVIMLDVTHSPSTDSLSRTQQTVLRELAERYIKRYLNARLINRIVTGFRRSDMVVMCTEYESRLLVMCPSTNVEECNTLIQRIQGGALKDLEIPVSVGAASFPNDGFTLDALIQAAESNLTGGKTAAPVEETEEQAA
jgi:GGDEF domain-containing protein